MLPYMYCLEGNLYSVVLHESGIITSLLRMRKLKLARKDEHTEGHTDSQGGPRTETAVSSSSTFRIEYYFIMSDKSLSYFLFLY